jgi:hypothetical protein
VTEVTVPADLEARKLRRLEDRYRNELMPEEERCELRDRILKLRRDMDALDAQHSCLERLEAPE